MQLEFNEATGSSFADTSGYANTAVAPTGGIAAGSTGHTSFGVAFSGGVITIAGPTQMPDSAQVWVEAWVQPQAPLTGTRTILTKAGSYALKQLGTELSFQVTGSASTTPCIATSTGVALAPGNFYHVAGWYDGLRATVAVNGRPRATVACPNGPVAPSTAGPFHVGGIYSGTVSEAYAGTIDEVRVRSVAAQSYGTGGATYLQWGASSCTNGAQTLYSGVGFANHYTHSGSSEPLCLKKGTATGAPQAYAGDLMYAMAINGGAVHQGVILDDKRIQCSLCSSHRSSCFRLDGAQACPAGYNAQYTGYMYGSHYTHAMSAGRLCIDHLNFDNSLPNSPNSAAHFYPTRVHDPANSTVPANNGVGCVVCCSDF